MESRLIILKKYLKDETSRKRSWPTMKDLSHFNKPSTMWSKVYSKIITGITVRILIFQESRYKMHSKIS